MDFRNYTIVIPQNAHVDVKAAALRLQAHFQTEDCPLPIVTDNTPATEYEIILGMQNRPECRRIRPDRYLISIKDEKKIVVDAVHYLAVCAAVDTMCKWADWQVNLSTYRMDYVDIPLTWGEYQLVWNDEFDGTTVDANKWVGRDETPMPDVKTGMARGSVDVQDSTLVMTAHTAIDGYTTAKALTTAATMNYQYGYLEIRARVPRRGLGEWPSVRLSNANCELAVGEKVGDAMVAFLENTSEKFKNKSAVLSYDDRQTYEFSPEEDGNDWHTYGCLWTPDEMSFSIDGIFYARNDIKDKKECHQPMYLLMQNLLFTEGFKKTAAGEWAKDKPNPHEDLFPVHFDVNYCRLYQKPGQGKLYLPTEAVAE